jgi:hypothetical protein
MDPIHPIVPGPTPISARLPVQPLERVSRERDRPGQEGQQGRRRQPPPASSPQGEPDGLGEDRGEEGDDGRPRIDIRA